MRSASLASSACSAGSAWNVVSPCANGNVNSLQIAPGAFHLPGHIPRPDQRTLVAELRALIDGAVPAYVPVVRGASSMHVRMLCLGRHWNGKTYRYEPTRSDFDNLPAPPLPPDLKALAADIAGVVGMKLDADLCII